MKRIIALMLMLVLALGLMAGCGKDKNKDDAGNTGVSGDIINKADVSFVVDGASNYRIVRPEGDTDATQSAQFVFQQMKKALGVSVRNVSDTEDGADTYEILIGNTNREESKKAAEYLKAKTGGRYDDYIVCTIGKKICIYSSSAEGTKAAAEYFITNFCKPEGIKGGIEYVKATDGNFENITVNGKTIGEYTIVRPHYNSSWLTEVEIEEVIESVYTKTGYKLSFVHDTLSTPADYEIIVGNTNREGVEAITNYDDYKITISGKKIYINGGSAHATAIAVSEFGKMLKGDLKDSSSVSGNYETTFANYDKSTEFYKTWGDDFDGDALDTTKWRQQTETNRTAGQNGKISVRSSDPDRVYQTDGKFYITAGFDDEYYYGGMIRTQGIMTYKYGYAEMSALLPHGGGMWIAWWACTSDSNSPITGEPKLVGPEIDIVEMFGNSGSYAANCHTWPSTLGKEAGIEHYSLDGKFSNQKKYNIPDAGARLADGFHTYGFLWDNTQMSFTCDGDLFFKYDITGVNEEKDVECFNQSLYFIFSMATAFESGSSLADETSDDWNTTNILACDWMNIYQKDDGMSELNWSGAN